MSHLSFLQDLKSIRDYFEINYINLLEQDDTGVFIYIKPSDNGNKKLYRKRL